jgi:hypothetical protein
MPLVTVCRPDAGEPEEPPGRLAERGVRGARLVLIDNGKPNARELLELLGAELDGRIALEAVELVTKPSAGHPLEAARAEELAGRAGMVVAALGDCGACSACSLRDAIAFETLGVPAAVVITDAFVGHVAHFAELLGLPGYPALVVPHPVSSKPRAHLERLAAGIADSAVAQLT